jgi:nucleotide-binding universal stress UspA family protein
MSLIVCATGNGSQSRKVQSEAVEEARRQQKPLVFLHVVDLRQMGELDESLIPAATTELAWLGNAILRLAEDRARRRGVHAESVVLYGDVATSLETFLREKPVDLLLMGKATNEAFGAFAQKVRDELGIPVQFVTLGG